LGEVQSVSPQELRAFREGLGLSRREFAPKLFISEPTLERWERGQGGPREIHLQILRRMREHLGTGQSFAYFQYDSAQDTVDPSHDRKRVVIEALRSAGALLRREEDSDDGSAWVLHFGLDWASRESADVPLTCEGSYRPERPFVDLTLHVVLDPGRPVDITTKELADLFFTHRIVCRRLDRAKRGAVLELGQRIFDTGFNSDTVRHVLRSYQSCWNRLVERVVRNVSPEQRSRKRRAALSGAPGR
jgi:transcriptional regulator with XRE-family HTH domain